MAKLLPACRCSRFYRALLLPLLLVVLLVGQSRVVLGDAVAAAGGEGQRTVAVDALGEMEVVDSLPLKDVQQQVREYVCLAAGVAVMELAQARSSSVTAALERLLSYRPYFTPHLSVDLY